MLIPDAWMPEINDRLAYRELAMCRDTDASGGSSPTGKTTTVSPRQRS